MRAVIYARYSAGPNQTERSIEGQVRVCTDYCKANNLTVQEIYADRHISGKTDERPEFQRLIADCKLKKFDAIVVYKTDRLSRDKYDAVFYKREIKKTGVRIFYAAEAIPDGPEGIILESLMEGLAEYYSAELAQKIRRGIHENALKCKVLGNGIPLGYKRGPNNEFEIDEPAAEAVRTIFKMYLEHKSNADIVRYLNGLGYKTSQGNPFNKNSVSRIIRNEKYIGVYSGAGVTVENGIPAIIDASTFYLAQKEVTTKRTSKVTRLSTANYLLSGKLICGHCHKNMVGVSGTSKTGAKHFYYYCPTARKKAGCEKKHVQKDYIESLVVDLTKDYLLKPGVIEDIAHKVWLLQSKNDHRPLKIAELSKRLQENKKAVNELIKAIEKGLATTTLLVRLDQLEKEQTTIESELAYQKTKQFGLSEDQLAFFLYKFIQEPSEDLDCYKKRIISTFVSSVVLYDNKLDIHYNITNAENKKSDAISSSLMVESSNSVALSGNDGSQVEPVKVLYNMYKIIISYKLKGPTR